MIAVQQTGQALHVTVNEVANFDSSRQMLLACKPHLKLSKPDNIVVTLNQITDFHSCMIGALLVLHEAVQGNIAIHLRNCSREVHELYESEVLMQHFGEARSLTSKLLAVCSRCLNADCKSSGVACTQPIAA